MVKAQEWLDRTTAESKAEVKRISQKSDIKKIGNDLLSMFTKGRPLSSVLSNVVNNIVIDENISLEGPLSFKGFVNLEYLNISNQKITTLDVSDCLQLRELRCSSNQLTNLDVSNNRQIEQIHCTDNQLTNLDFTGLDKIEKVFCCDNKLTNLEFLKALKPAKLITLRVKNNKFPVQDLSCFTPFVNLERLFIDGNPFYGSLKPLMDLTNLKEIGISRTDIDSGLEYLPDDFFNVNATASSLGLRGGHFSRKLTCSGKLAEQLENYKIENDPLRNYDWQAWKRDNQELIDKTKEQVNKEELTNILEWEVIDS
ncbi:hypothetical protein RclHR1_03010009 [Rhizophagus clarus]|uniref:T9SS type A sorting domain-containing protein n=1 Tax=Rhizophagus clarus TaxID=94130 RepID=A0A2Z6RZV3_9GLOM|nr:hypothetical protein RclHR1_03010009 [Rhizophagus clarus]GES85623.1 T9SS type A sorting domain-containing protein [Rhizophagus clarus]